MQEQQFTLILQTLQQLRDVYGESVDKIVQGRYSYTMYKMRSGVWARHDGAVGNVMGL